MNTEKEYGGLSPPMCQYCGSIENNGIKCSWCHNYISEIIMENDEQAKKKKESEDLKMLIKMTVEATPEQAIQIAHLLCKAIPTDNSINTANAHTPAVPITVPARVTAAPMAAPAQIPIAPAQSPMAPIPAAPVPVQVPVAPVPTAPITQQSASIVPTVPAPVYDIEMLGCAAAPLAMQGKRQELTNLLHSFGVEALTQLPPDKYGEMAMKLRELGAQI